MTKLEAVMAKLKRVHVECATSQVQFMELTRANVQIQPAPFQSLKEEMAKKGHFLYSTWIQEITN